jgi:hypothetical protein
MFLNSRRLYGCRKIREFRIRSVVGQDPGSSGARKILRKKNSHLNQSLIIIQSDHRYCQYNNEGGNKIILPLFKSYLCCYCESLWQHFPPVLLKLQHKKKSHGNFLDSRSSPARFIIHYTISMYSMFENKRTDFTKF